MRFIKILFLITPIIAASFSSWAATGRLAGEEDIKLLKQDLLAGEIEIGKARLKDIREGYGDASSITESDNKVTYDYGDIKIDFDKNKYLRKWEYDYSHKPGYSDDIDDLRNDLEDQQIVGDLVTLEQILDDYDEPTEAIESGVDGEMSIYYYGEIKLTFENVYTLRSWRGKKLEEVEDKGLLRDGSYSTDASGKSKDKKSKTDQPAKGGLY